MVAAVVMVSHSRLLRDGSGISHVENTLISSIFETCVMDRRTDGHTDGRTDGQEAKHSLGHTFGLTETTTE